MRIGSVATVAAVGAFGVAVTFGLIARAIVLESALPTHETTVIVPTGATGHEVARLLTADGIISSALAFDVLARLEGKQSAIKAGEFRFAARTPLQDVLHEVTESGRQVAVWVTIPEGFTAKEIAHALAAKGLGGYGDLETAFLGRPLDVDGTEVPTREGYLFPDTYLIATSAKPAEIAQQLTDEFFVRLPPDARRLARKLGLTVPQVVTIASLVEREAKVDDERPLMAGVYYNRLRRGMPLEVDATIEYTFAHHKDAITYTDLARDSPYNTYRHMGLPPTPIANPGSRSLQAAFHPRPSDYLYYVSMGNGRHAFSRTLAGHNANVARYLR